MFQDVFQSYLKFVFVFPVLFWLLFFASPAQALAGDCFLHTHTDACARTESVLCDYEHTSYDSHEIITRHCTYCLAQTAHSHYLTNYCCTQTGCRQTVAGSTACLTCHNAGYRWGTDVFSHYREDTVYVCGAGQSEVTAKVTLSGGGGEMTNQDVLLYAGVEIRKPELAGSGFSYSWDGGSTWSTEAVRAVKENGTYTVMVKNQKGEIADAAAAVTNIDKIAPVINSIDADTDGMTNQEILVTVSAADENGIAGYSFDGGATWQSGAGFRIQAGRKYQVLVKDAAGNTAVREIRREDFPYPPAPEVQPPSKKPETDGQSGTGTDTRTSGKKEQAVYAPGKKETGRDGQETAKKVSQQVKNGREQTEKDASRGKKEAGSGLVPKITVSQNRLPANTVSGNTVFGTAAEEGGGMKKTDGGNGDGTPTGEEALVEDAAVSESDGDGREAGMFGPAPLSLLTAGLLLGAGAAGFFLLYFGKSGVLYAMDDTQGRPFFRRLQRVRLKKCEKGYEMMLPEYLERLDGSGHFRILLSRTWLQEGKNGKIAIYTGKRKLVADMEECIDFVL